MCKHWMVREFKHFCRTSHWSINLKLSDISSLACVLYCFYIQVLDTKFYNLLYLKVSTPRGLLMYAGSWLHPCVQVIGCHYSDIFVLLLCEILEATNGIWTQKTLNIKIVCSPLDCCCKPGMDVVTPHVLTFSFILNPKVNFFLDLKKESRII